MNEPKPGDRVAYSANFLSSVCLGTGGGVSGGRGAAVGEAPHRRGVLIGKAPDSQIIADVRWDDDPGQARGVHLANIVRLEDLNRDADRAAHDR
jgi:hypothetical protein